MQLSPHVRTGASVATSFWPGRGTEAVNLVRTKRGVETSRKSIRSPNGEAQSLGWSTSRYRKCCGIEHVWGSSFRRSRISRPQRQLHSMSKLNRTLSFYFSSSASYSQHPFNSIITFSPTSTVFHPRSPHSNRIGRRSYFGQRSGSEHRKSHSRQNQSSHPRVPNHYAVLGVSPDASAREIKSQFYALSKKHHPDMMPAKDASAPASSPSSPTLFYQISDAYHTLSNPVERGKYDKQYQRAYGPILNSGSGSGSAHNPFGSHSHSSHQAARARARTQPGGARPPTGLRNNRGPLFTGPPPSYFTSGGGSGGGAGAGSTGTFRSPNWRENNGPDAGELHNANAPHWDARSHLRTQHVLWQRRTGQHHHNTQFPNRDTPPFPSSHGHFSEHYTFSSYDGDYRSRRSESPISEAALRSTSLAHFAAVSAVVLLSIWSFRRGWNDESDKQ